MLIKRSWFEIKITEREGIEEEKEKVSRTES